MKINDIQNRITPEIITKLEDNEIFVFGANKSGIMGAGAAKIAFQRFGAKWGVGVGITGKCYAIPTKDYGIRRTLTIDEIKPYVNDFIKYAKDNESLIFLVTEIGCGLANYKPHQIAPLFINAIEIENIYLPLRFWEILLNEKFD